MATASDNQGDIFGSLKAGRGICNLQTLGDGKYIELATGRLFEYVGKGLHGSRVYRPLEMVDNTE